MLFFRVYFFLHFIKLSAGKDKNLHGKSTRFLVSQPPCIDCISFSFSDMKVLFSYNFGLQKESLQIFKFLKV